MKLDFNQRTHENITSIVISGLILLCVWFLFERWDAAAAFFAKIGSALAPFVYGFFIALIAMPLRRIVENKWLKNMKWKTRTKRRTATAFSIIVLLLLIVAFFSVLIPQIVSSGQTLASSMNDYVESFENLLPTISSGESKYAELFEKGYTYLNNMISDALNGENGLVHQVLSASVTIVKGIFNFFIGVIVAVYLLVDTQRWKRQLKQVTYAVFSKRAADSICRFAQLLVQMLNSFLFGKALDSLIIGVLCGVVCGIMQMPYTPLIAFVVGITNMIPIFGPFIGAIPCIFILLLIDPWKALEFTVFILILQQIDGNIIGPYILGDSMGLPALWVMFAIIVGGALWGVMGMLLGVPVFSVIYVLVREHTSNILKKKQIQIE